MEIYGYYEKICKSFSRYLELCSNISLSNLLKLKNYSFI